VKIWIGRDRSINEIDGGLVVADKHGGNQPGGAQRSVRTFPADLRTDPSRT
jgi:hypothetical protein